MFIVNVPKDNSLAKEGLKSYVLRDYFPHS